MTDKFTYGDKVRLHPIIGGKHNGRVYEFVQYCGKDSHAIIRDPSAVNCVNGNTLEVDVRGVSKI